MPGAGRPGWWAMARLGKPRDQGDSITGDVVDPISEDRIRKGFRLPKPWVSRVFYLTWYYTSGNKGSPSGQGCLAARVGQRGIGGIK